jgi:hypothetical protein
MLIHRNVVLSVPAYSPKSPMEQVHAWPCIGSNNAGPVASCRICMRVPPLDAVPRSSTVEYTPRKVRPRSWNLPSG